jgi:hypothetical protein
MDRALAWLAGDKTTPGAAVTTASTSEAAPSLLPLMFSDASCDSSCPCNMLCTTHMLLNAITRGCAT